MHKQTKSIKQLIHVTVQGFLQGGEHLPPFVLACLLGILNLFI